MKKMLAVLALSAFASQAHAEPPYPRIMSGLFCNNAGDLKTVAENVPVLKRNALKLVNVTDVICVLHEQSRAVVTSMKFVRVERVTNQKLYLYEATIKGFYFGASYVVIEPEVTQYVYMATAQKPEDETEES